MKAVTVYSRRGCHLCEDMLESIEPLIRGRATLEVRDVDARAEWADEFGLKVPVLFVGDREICHYTLDSGALSAALSDDG